jgi:hypothetical protein
MNCVSPLRYGERQCAAPISLTWVFGILLEHNWSLVFSFFPGVELPVENIYWEGLVSHSKR